MVTRELVRWPDPDGSKSQDQVRVHLQASKERPLACAASSLIPSTVDKLGQYLPMRRGIWV